MYIITSENLPSVEPRIVAVFSMLKLAVLFKPKRSLSRNLVDKHGDVGVLL